MLSRWHASPGTAPSQLLNGIATRSQAPSNEPSEISQVGKKGTVQNLAQEANPGFSKQSHIKTKSKW